MRRRSIKKTKNKKTKNLKYNKYKSKYRKKSKRRYKKTKKRRSLRGGAALPAGYKKQLQSTTTTSNPSYDRDTRATQREKAHLKALDTHLDRVQQWREDREGDEKGSLLVWEDVRDQSPSENTTDVLVGAAEILDCTGKEREECKRLPNCDWKGPRCCGVCKNK